MLKNRFGRICSRMFSILEVAASSGGILVQPLVLYLSLDFRLRLHDYGGWCRRRRAFCHGYPE